jgi:hypothetical protein
MAQIAYKVACMNFEGVSQGWNNLGYTGENAKQS